MSSTTNSPKVKPLFIPLKRKFFEAFERGQKTQEFRLWGPRWNERTLIVGRPVILSLGYSGRRLNADIVAVLKTDPAWSRFLPGWVACYGPEPRSAAVITLAVAKP